MANAVVAIAGFVWLDRVLPNRALRAADHTVLRIVRRAPNSEEPALNPKAANSDPARAHRSTLRVNLCGVNIAQLSVVGANRKPARQPDHTHRGYPP